MELDLPTITHKKKATWKGKGKGKGKESKRKLKSKATTRTDRPTLTNNDIECKKCYKPEGTDMNEPIWVGCDSCDEYWVHLHCLELGH